MRIQKCFFRRTALLCSVLLFLSSCSKNDDHESDMNGSIRLNLSLDSGIVIKDSDFKSSNLDEFTVNIYKSDNSLFLSYPQVIDVPAIIQLELGSYYVEVSSDDLQEAAFDSPFYEGVSEVFTVNSGETADIEVVCTLENVAVSVTYSQNVINDFLDYNTTVSTTAASLVFGRDETRIGYFTVGHLHIECVLEYQDAQGDMLTKTISANIDNPVVKRCYEIVVDVSLGDPEGVLNVSLDESVDTETVVLSDTDASGISAGDIIMTEFIANPDILADTEGEWMEFYNTTSEDIDLQDFTVLRVGSSSTFTINQSLIIPLGGFVVFAINTVATDQIDYDYNSFSLTNTSGQIQLISPGGTIVSDITYSSDLVSAGRSAQLCPANFNASDYNNMGNWILSSTEYMTGNTGSPRQVNEDCN